MANLYAILVLIALNIVCYFRSLNGFFLADDFSHIDYLHQVFAGHPEMLVQNFFSNWLQAQGTKFFRPFISITMAWDYLLWKNNPLGFHITNLSLQIASTILLYLIVKRLFPISKVHSFYLALGAAALFAVNPLHAEVVSWIIARVDSVASTFLLLSFYLHQRSLGRKDSQKSKNTRSFFTVGSFFSFLIALLSKETAIVLPAVLFLWHFLFPWRAHTADDGASSDAPSEATAKTFGIVDRCKTAMAKTWPYWLTLVVYLVYRSLALGTMIGGYGGAVGEGLTNSFWHRWLDPQSISKVFFPFNDEVFHNPSRFKRYLRWLYQAFAVLFVANSFFAFKNGKLTLYWSMIIFASGWFVIAMMPAYQVWNLAANLQGARFIYMGSLPLALLFSLIVIPVVQIVDKRAVKSNNEAGSPASDNLWLASRASAVASCLVMVSYIVLSASIAQKNDSAWNHASRGVKSLYRAMKAELSHTPADQQIVLLNLPFRYQGAHMLYNGFTFGALLRPPFMPEDNSKRVQLFEPIEYGDSDLINVSRLRAVTGGQKPLVQRIYKWDEEENKLLPISLSWERGKIEMRPSGTLHVGENQTVYSPALYLPSGALDYLDISMVLPPQAAKPDSLKLTWSGSSLLFPAKNFLWTKLDKVNNKVTARIYVSEHKKWLAAEQITGLGFQLYPERSYDIENLIVTSGRLEGLPTLSATAAADPKSGGMVQDELGMAHPHQKIGYLNYDASRVPNADHVVFQISKPDSWFEQVKGTFRDDAKENSQVGVSHSMKALTGSKVSFSASELTAPGFYEVRMGAAGKDGKIISSYSDPINFYLSEADIHAAK